MRVVVGRAERSLVHIELAEDDRPGCPQAGNRRGIFCRNAIGRSAEAVAGGDAGHVDIVLDRDRDPVERAEASLRGCPIGGGMRLRHGGFFAQGNQAVEPASDPFGTLEEKLCQ
jgi:hypothetical protein